MDNDNEQAEESLTGGEDLLSPGQRHGLSPQAKGSPEVY